MPPDFAHAIDAEVLGEHAPPRAGVLRRAGPEPDAGQDRDVGRHARDMSMGDRQAPADPLDPFVANPKNLRFRELESATLPRVLDQVDMAVINTNYALDAGLKPRTDALTLEGADSPYVNYLVARSENRADPRIVALAAMLRSQAVRDFIAQKYDGAVIPAA